MSESMSIPGLLWWAFTTTGRRYSRMLQLWHLKQS